MFLLAVSFPLNQVSLHCSPTHSVFEHGAIWKRVLFDSSRVTNRHQVWQLIKISYKYSTWQKEKRKKTSAIDQTMFSILKRFLCGTSNSRLYPNFFVIYFTLAFKMKAEWGGEVDSEVYGQFTILTRRPVLVYG